jgi:hypothetical protein
MKGVLAASTALVLASTLVTAAGVRAEPHAPPVLTPVAAATASVACPPAAPYAKALVAGITAAEAAAAVPLLRACAGATRLPELRWKNAAASLALAGVELSQGLLQHDPAMLKAASDATHALRASLALSDAQVLTWNLIPDVYDARARTVYYVPGSCGNAYMNAVYINVAARNGIAWLTAPDAIRDGPVCANALANRDLAQLMSNAPGANPGSNSAWVPRYGDAGVVVARPTQAPDEVNQEGSARPPPR